VALIRHGARLVVESRGAHRAEPVDPPAIAGVSAWRKDADAGQVATAPDVTLPSGAVLVIHRFEIDGRQLDGSEDRRVAEDVEGIMHTRLLAAMTGTGSFARVADGGSPDVLAGPEVLALRGRISDLDLGSRTLRIVVGFGAGRTRLQVETQLVADDGRTLVATVDRRIATKGWTDSRTFLVDSAEDIAKGCAAYLRRWAATGASADAPGARPALL
jgi:hypothetical protein